MKRMPKTQEQFEKMRNEKRTLIMKTALSLFANQGYQDTTISKIAQTAGMSKGLMYNYFKSKEELLQNIMETLDEEVGGWIDPNHDGIVTDEEAAGFIDFVFDIMSNRNEEMKLYYQLSFQPQVMDILLEKFNGAGLTHYTQLIVAYFSKKLSIADPMIAMLSIISFLKGLCTVYIYTYQTYPDDFTERYKTYLKETFIFNTDKHKQ